MRWVVFLNTLIHAGFYCFLYILYSGKTDQEMVASVWLTIRLQLMWSSWPATATTPWYTACFCGFLMRTRQSLPHPQETSLIKGQTCEHAFGCRFQFRVTLGLVTLEAAAVEWWSVAGDRVVSVDWWIRKGRESLEHWGKGHFIQLLSFLCVTGVASGTAA